eukprot:2374628-Pleurochrysis_carterae.AAC.1
MTRFNHLSRALCVYGRPVVVAKRGVEARSTPRHGSRSSKSRRARAALVALAPKGRTDGNGE